MNKLLLPLLVVFLLLPATALAGLLPVDVILGLLDAGVSDLSIQRYVERNKFTFDLKAEDLQALKKAGASDGLISFLQDREEGVPSGMTESESQPSKGSGEEPGYVLESPPADYGVSSYAPAYSFGLYFGYPAYSGYYYPYNYPYYYPYYYPSYYHPYYPHSHYYYGGGYHRGGSGVVSYWHHGHSGRGTARPPAAPPPRPPSRTHPGGGHGGGRGRH
jgi:hypothetical protein